MKVEPLSDVRNRLAAIDVTAPARLHLGFLDLDGGLGRRFGSLGLAIDQPSTRVIVSRAPGSGARHIAVGGEAARALKALERFTDVLRLQGRYRAEVLHAIPPHAGLGSGTQLAIAIGVGLAQLEGLAQTARSLAEIQERGARSAIGMAAFEDGGFIVDGGRGTGEHAPPVLMRSDFPSDWRVLLVLDRRAEGVHGDGELVAFAKLPPFKPATAAHLCHLMMMRVMPAAIESDLASFGNGLTEIQQIIGGHFAAAQGGSPWTSPAVGRIVAKMGQAGATGLGQSSWGPTGFAFIENEDAAQRLYCSFVQDAMAEELEILIARGRNAGARVDRIATSPTKA